MAGKFTTVLPAALVIFALSLGLFGGIAYGSFELAQQGSAWIGFLIFLATFVALGVMVSALRNFFGKYSGKLMFAMWLIGILASYFVFLFQNSKYPMGIDLAGGTELIYRLDYTQTRINIEKTTDMLNQAIAKDPNSAEVRRFREAQQTMEQSMKTAPDKAAEVVRKRVDPTGTKGIPVTTYGSDKQRLRIQLPRATLEEVANVKKAIETQGRLGFHIVADNESIKQEVMKSPTGLSADGQWEKRMKVETKQFTEKEEKKETPVVIRRVPGMDGSKVAHAIASHSQEGAGWEINLTFTPEGAVEFGQLTEQNKKKQMAIVLDGIIYSDPTIQEAIFDRCRISGSFDEKRAEDLAAVLTAGSLPAEVKYENEFTVGPTLGKEQIASGMMATVIGTLAVMLFMLIYYRLAGAIAGFCTMLTIITLLGAMGFFKATLTLPGIAGIVLTLGMSVDANVLILERLREELELGRNLRIAVAHAFDRAFITIIDCHITTIVSGVVMYYLGTGPVRGFAVSLTIGILITLFCNLWLNWIIMEWVVSKDIVEKFKMLHMFDVPHIDFMGKRKLWMSLTAGLAVVSLAMVLFAEGVFKMDLYDVDFTGGTLVQFNFAAGKAQDEQLVKDKIKKEVIPAVEKSMGDVMAKEGRKEIEMVVQSFGSPDTAKSYRSYTVTTRVTDPAVIEAFDKQLETTFKNELEPPAIETHDKAMMIRFVERPGLSVDEIKKRLEEAKTNLVKDLSNADIAPALQNLSVTNTESKAGYTEVTLTSLPDDAKVRENVVKALESTRLADRAGGPISRKNSFGAQVAGEMKWQALWALAIANLGVFIYLWFRFEFSGAWGFGAIVALIHDVVIAAGGVVVANLCGWSMPIDLNIVAALLTIVGFSVNDTIVVFDRIREVKAAHPTRSYEEIVNEAVNATLSRTILTSATVLIADLSLLIFGGPTIRGMAWTLLVGFTVGTYSSIFIASPLMIWWYRKFGSGVAPVPTSSAPKPPRGDAAAGAEV